MFNRTDWYNRGGEVRVLRRSQAEFYGMKKGTCHTSKKAAAVSRKLTICDNSGGLWSSTSILTTCNVHIAKNGMKQTDERESRLAFEGLQ